MKHVGSLESTQEARVASNPKQSSNNIALIKVLHCAHISQANMFIDEYQGTFQLIFRDVMFSGIRRKLHLFLISCSRTKVLHK